MMPATRTSPIPPATGTDGGRALDDRIAEVLPVLREESRPIDDTAEFPVRGLDALRRSGLMGLLVPAESGGLGGDLADLVRVSVELAGACLSTALIWAMHCQQVAALVGHAGPELRGDLLPRIGGGEVYVASVTSERGKGGHLLTAEAPLDRQDPCPRLSPPMKEIWESSRADGAAVKPFTSVSRDQSGSRSFGLLTRGAESTVGR